ncbi:MAG: tyrosine-type recombinase/integrase [Alphaproteobacteria bacterium]|nr:tyrosine-type recombinase/integrase [Alphaproteobacteria bacterium]
MKLNDTKCKNAKPLDPPSKSPRKLSDGMGLYLYVMPNGAKYWRFIYRFNGKQKLLAMGVYPEITLKEAREKCLKLRRMVIDGKDPALEQKKQKAMAIIDNNNTFEAVARDWYDYRKDQWRPKYADDVIKRLETDIFPHIGDIPIKEIEPPLLLQVVRKVEKRGAHELARRQLQKCGEIFRFAIAEGRAVRDPSADIKEALRPFKKTHFASLEVNELPAFIKALEHNDARLYQSTRNALNLMMLTFVRTSELINAKWEEIDFERKEWIIPAERMKMGKKHVVPLSDQAIQVLENQKVLAGHWPLVFPSSFKPKQSISNNTILGAIKRLGYQGRMTGHGFRALAMGCIKQELGYRHEVVDRQLAHQPRSKVDKAYDRADFLDERRVMMQEWANYIDKIKEGGK